MPLFIAGIAFPYPEHQAFLRNEILPHLNRTRRWVGAVAGMRKQRLLGEAACLLAPSKAPETSSLVAMEALAAGTPVIAYRQGELPDIVEHGRTGFIVDDVDEMAAAIGRVGRILPEECRRAARERFPLRKATDAYLQRYAELAVRVSSIAGLAGGAVVTVIPPGRIEAMRGEWEQLWADTPRATPFAAPAWRLPWARHYAPGRCWAAALTIDGVLAAWLPVFCWQRAMLLAGTGPSDHGTALFRPGAERYAGALIDAALGALASSIERIEFYQLDPASPPLAAEPPHGWTAGLDTDETCPALNLPAAGGMGLCHSAAARTGATRCDGSTVKAASWSLCPGERSTRP